MDIEIFKNKLEKERVELETALSSIGTQNPKNTSDWRAKPEEDNNEESGYDENADRFEEYGNRNAVVEDLEKRLVEVKAALKRMEEGTYGICEVSGEPIEEQRLQANPAARTCVKHLS